MLLLLWSLEIIVSNLHLEKMVGSGSITLSLLNLVCIVQCYPIAKRSELNLLIKSIFTNHMFVLLREQGEFKGIALSKALTNTPLLFFFVILALMAHKLPCDFCMSLANVLSIWYLLLCKDSRHRQTLCISYCKEPLFLSEFSIIFKQLLNLWCLVPLSSFIWHHDVTVI